jgi:NADPH:quinone reductase-like Zn-dependent oxidoreductase
MPPELDTDAVLFHKVPEIPDVMQADVMWRKGGPEVLEYSTRPTPKPGPGEALVRVHAATVNHTDLFHRSGRFFIQKDLPHILGMDVAGEIALLGEGVTGWAIGDRVVATFEALGRERNGTYAEFTTIPVEQLHRIPDDLDSIAAAAIGLAFTTAWIALIDNGGLNGRDRVVVNAASSGVGTSALQIARWKGARTIAISDIKKAKRLLNLGADHVLDRRSPRLLEDVAEAAGSKGASLVLNQVGAETVQQSIAMLGRGGRIVCVGTLAGDKAEIDVMDLLMKNAAIRGSFGTIAREDFDTILRLFANGTFQPVIDSIWGLRSAPYAHELIENQEVFGKVVLVPVLPGDDGHWARESVVQAGPQLDSRCPDRRLVKGFDGGGGVFATEVGDKIFLVYDEKSFSGEFDEDAAFDLQHRMMRVIEFDRPIDRERYFREKGWGSYRESERVWATNR